jgi:acetyl esterase/lipase
VHEAKLTPLVEDIGDDAKLLWIGPKITDNVLLYFHGGAFLFGMPPPAPKYWRYIQEHLEMRGKKVGLAILNYTLVPDGSFPIQLKQGILAIQNLIKMGVKPENIQILGDSAGGALIHQTFSHFLHPVSGVPELSLSAPLGGVYMMSPWVRLVDKDRQYLYSNDNNGDLLTGNQINYWGSEVFQHAPDEALPYLEPNSAPPKWLDGVDRFVKRVFISAGGVECLRDEIIKYQDRFQEHHKDVTFVLQANGIHDDPYWDFATHEKDLGELTPQILDWLDENFTKRDSD